MFNNDKSKQLQVSQMLNLIKIASLAFPAIAFLQYYSTESVFFYNTGILLIIVLGGLLLAYTIWSIIQAKLIKKPAFKMWIDPLVSLIIFTLVLILTGKYESSYKFLYVFVIISSSIELNMKASLTISGLSAAIVLAIDLIFAPNSSVNTFFESDIVLACVFLILSWTIGYYVNIGDKHIQNLNDLANIDGLTGLYNHRFFYECLSEQISASKNNGTELSLLFIDIDNFKLYNDLYGHQKGDEALSIISEIMKDNVRKDNIIARYGGEEFTVLLSGVGSEIAVKIAERLRSEVEYYPFEGEINLPGGGLTISVGVSSYPSKAKTGDELIKGADDACYRAKFLRKNRVEAYSSILEEIQNHVDEPDKEIVASIKTLIAVINAKDKYTYRHVERVVYYCTMLADTLSLSDKEKKDLVYAAYLHDIGKINIPEEILTKPDTLTFEEWELLKSHPNKAAEIIKNIQSLQDLVPIILQHHEKYDGSGYPNRLKGEDIHYLARVLTVIDSYDAMTSIRPYQQRKTHMQGLAELRRCSGTHFDPEIVKVFVNCIQAEYSLMH